MGKSSRLSTMFFPGKLAREIAYAAGIAISIAITAAIVAVVTLSLMANKISRDSNAEMKVSHSVKDQRDAKMPMKNMAIITRALIVATLKALSPPVPLSILNISTYLMVNS